MGETPPTSAEEADDLFGIRPITPWGPVAAETRAFNKAARDLLADVPPPEATDIPAIRQLRAEGKGVLPVDGPMPEGRWQEIPAAPGRSDGAQVRILDPEGGAGSAKGVYLHIHGGGWTFGAADQADGRNLRLAAAAGVTVVSVAYRLAPENPWPAPSDDCLAAARWAIEFAAGRPLVIGGESAGAHLSAVTLLRLREVGLIDRVRAAALTYGAFDMRLPPSVRNWGPRNLVLSYPVVRWFAGNLLPDASLAETPAVSPILAELEGLVPAYFQCGTEDPLLDDTLFMEARWRAAGNAAELKIWPGGIHAFDYFDDPRFNLPMAAEAQGALARYIGRMVAA